ncbi:MAG TPA: TonB-dependent receptor plug domain-containing protein [Longimicrobiales bacterium]|nr:TonB-dependent receptor plug domain-containing protein [Longimicrobiales bacterium]
MPRTTVPLALLAPLALTLLAHPAAAQRREITGHIVVQGTEQPVPGVAVRLAGSRSGVCTGPDGEFYLQAPEGAARLEIQLPGWQGAIELPADQDDLTLKVAPHVVRLPAVVVTAAAAEPSAGNSAVHMTAADLARGTGSSLGTLLQGRVAGANIEAGSGMPGRGFRLRFRGINSIFGGTNPLVVIDGVVVSTPSPVGTRGPFGFGAASEDPFSSLNPADIESIEVLRGAAGSALYGTLGSNGALLIRTKRGRPPVATTDSAQPGVCQAPR